MIENFKESKFLLTNRILVSLLSIIATHSLALPLCSTFPVSELQYILNQSKTIILLASSKFITKAKQTLDACDQSRPRLIQIEKRMGGSRYQKISLNDSLGPEGGLILYTSGTTNRPVCGLNKIDLAAER